MEFVYINGANHDGYAQLDVFEHKAKTMTVKELMDALSTLNPNAKVLFGSNYGDYTVEDVANIG